MVASLWWMLVSVTWAALSVPWKECSNTLRHRLLQSKDSHTEAVSQKYITWLTTHSCRHHINLASCCCYFWCLWDRWKYDTSSSPQAFIHSNACIFNGHLFGKHLGCLYIHVMHIICVHTNTECTGWSLITRLHLLQSSSNFQLPLSSSVHWPLSASTTTHFP